MLALGVTIGLLMLERMYDSLSDLLGFGANYLDILKYFLMVIPSFLPTIIPLSLLISLLFTLGAMRRANEITALQAGGLSLWKITRTLWFSAAGLTILMFYLSAQVIPFSVVRAREIWDNLAYDRQLETKASSEIALLYNLTFYNAAQNRLWYINRFSQYDYIAHGITCSQLDAQGNEHERIVANQGYFDDILGYWVFEDGRRVTFDVTSGEPIRSEGFDKIMAKGHIEDPTLMQALEKKPKSLSMNELSTLINHLAPDNDPRANTYIVQYQSLWAAPLACILVVGIALPFALGNNRRNAMMSAGTSVVYFFLYYFASRLFIVMGSRSVLDPILAAWLPAIIMAAAIPVLIRKKLAS